MKEKDLIKDLDNDKVSKGYKHIKKYLTTYVVGLISIVYSFWGYFSIVGKHRTPLELIASGALSVAVALTIDFLLRLQGLSDGAETEKVKEAEMVHHSKVTEAEPYFIYEDEWVESENEDALARGRKYLLNKAGLRYSDFFSEDGQFLETEVVKPSKDADVVFKKRYKEKLEAIEKAIKYRPTLITLSSLVSDKKVSIDTNDLGQTVDDYIKSKSTTVGIMKVLGFFLFGLVTIEPILTSGWSGLMYGLIQTSLFLMFGSISYILAWLYMKNGYLDNLTKKNMKLNKLINFGKQKQQEVLKNAN